MEGSVHGYFVAREKKYNEQINKLKALGKSSDEVEMEYQDFIFKSMPFLEQTEETSARNKVDLKHIFSTRKEDGIFNDYMIAIDVRNHKPKQVSIIPTCPYCEEETLILKNKDTSSSCTSCGCEVSGFQIDTKPSFKDQDRITYQTQFTYKRETHFKEWIEQIESSNVYDMPNEILESVKKELAKQRITDPDTITAPTIRAVLKKIKLNKYYDFVPVLVSQVTHRPPLSLSEELKSKLFLMFKEVQKIFHDHAPANRHNFFSYPYILYKFCELLDADHVLPYLTLLKSREKLYQQDLIFKSICGALNWEFIKTI